MAEQMNSSRAEELARKWKAGTISDEERSELDAWYSSFDASYLQEDSTETADALKERLFLSIKTELEISGPVAKQTVLFPWKRLMAAAAILVFISAGLYFYTSKQHTDSKERQFAKKIRIHPGGNKAILTLHNGKQIVLADAKNGAISQQGNTEVIKLDSVLTYNQVNAGTEIVYNTITTPRGGQFQIVLSDGTKAWLNSASSLRFPTAFSDSDRTVAITGEVYFEVAKNPHKPFLVDVNSKQTVLVTGTHFNVMAYDDEAAIKTTLLEGSVLAQKDAQSVALKPGQQAQLSTSGKLTLVPEADTEAAVAWKNGLTSFADADIQSIMRQISRWYDVDVTYRGTLSKRTFTGGISRKSDIEGLFKVLALSNIHFSVTGKTVTVTP